MQGIYKCHICSTPSTDRMFEKAMELNNHLAQIHSHKEKGHSHFLCGLCFFSWRKDGRKGYLSRIIDHNKAHGQNSIPKKCPVPNCGSFETWEEYRNHIIIQHIENNGKRFFCYIASKLCDCTSTIPWIWLKHVEREVSSSCHQCQRRFGNDAALGKHLKNNHIDDAPMPRHVTILQRSVVFFFKGSLTM